MRHSRTVHKIMFFGPLWKIWCKSVGVRSDFEEHHLLFFYIHCCDSRGKTLSAERLHTILAKWWLKKKKKKNLKHWCSLKYLGAPSLKMVPKWNLTVLSPADALYNNNNRWDPSGKSNISCQVYMVLLTRICVVVSVMYSSQDVA